MLPIDDSLASLETGNNVYLHFNFRTGKFYSKIDASALPDSIIYQQLGLSQNQINKLKTNRIDHNANENYKNICAFPYYLSKNRVYVLIKYMHLESPISNGDTLYVNFRPYYFVVLLDLELKRVLNINLLKLHGDESYNSDPDIDFRIVGNEVLIGNYSLQKVKKKQVNLYFIYKIRGSIYSAFDSLCFENDTNNAQLKFQSDQIYFSKFTIDTFLSSKGYIYSFRTNKIIKNFNILFENLYLVHSFNNIQNKNNRWFIHYQTGNKNKKRNYIGILENDRVIYQKEVNEEIYFYKHDTIFELQKKENRIQINSYRIY